MSHVQRALRALARGFAPLFAILVLLLMPQTIAFGGPGGEGHTHGGEPAPAAGAGSPRVGMTGDNFELVAILKNGRVTFYLDRLDDNAPVTDATLEVTVGTEAVKVDANADGTYGMSGARFAQGGAHELTVSITANGRDDLLAGTLDVPAQHGDAQRAPSLLGLVGLPAPRTILIFAAGLLLGAFLATFGARRRGSAAGCLVLLLLWPLAAEAGPGGEGHSHGDEPATAVSDSPHRLPDGSVFVPKPTQRLMEVRTQRAEISAVRATVTFPGRVIASPQQSGIVQSINGGRISVADGRLPSLGQAVKKGDLLAIVERPVNAADETTILDKAGEISQQISLTETRLQRLASLAANNVVPKTQVADLETELAALRKRLGTIGTQRRLSEELRAPVDGEVAAVRVVAGQVVGPQDQLFQIVDPSAMWIEAFAFGHLHADRFDNAIATGAHGATLKLQFRGTSRVLQLHAAHIQFAIEDPPARLMVGEPVTVVAKTGEELKAIVLPRTAVVRASNGETIVWQHAAPERFMRIPVRTQPIDGERVAVLGPIEPGTRVVISGAELINQIR